MNLEVLTDPNAVAGRAADLIAETLRHRSTANLVLPTGQTPIRLYRELIHRSIHGELAMDTAQVYQLDELVGVPTDDQRSYHAFLRRTLLDQIPIPEENLHLLDGCAADLEQQVVAHRRALEAAGGADLIVLGLGRNGHVAFNEPGSERNSTARVVELHRTTTQGIEPHFEGGVVPSRGLTLGVADILAGRRILMLVTGANKAVILKSVLQEVQSPNRPASYLRDHPACTILADTAAGALIRGEEGRAAPV